MYILSTNFIKMHTFNAGIEIKSFMAPKPFQMKYIKSELVE